jgi:hypothetical protein
VGHGKRDGFQKAAPKARRYLAVQSVPSSPRSILTFPTASAAIYVACVQQNRELRMGWRRWACTGSAKIADDWGFMVSAFFCQGTRSFTNDVSHFRQKYSLARRSKTILVHLSIQRPGAPFEQDVHSASRCRHKRSTLCIAWTIPPSKSTRSTRSLAPAHPCLNICPHDLSSIA